MHLSLLGNIGCGKSSLLRTMKGYREMASFAYPWVRQLRYIEKLRLSI
jgi:ABC-type nitrate/sulfonate/bicarbonate transport system ATPase subunit